MAATASVGQYASRAPQGARELKFDLFLRIAMKILPSCPARGTWIEMAASGGGVKNRLVVPRKGHVD